MNSTNSTTKTQVNDKQKPLSQTERFFISGRLKLQHIKINADKFENLVGQDAKFNAEKMINIFKGEDNDFSKAVCLNAAAGLIVSEKYENFEIAYYYARDFIKTGAPYKHLLKIQNV